jgi:hypothetical protein
MYLMFVAFLICSIFAGKFVWDLIIWLYRKITQLILSIIGLIIHLIKLLIKKIISTLKFLNTKVKRKTIHVVKFLNLKIKQSRTKIGFIDEDEKLTNEDNVIELISDD